MSAIARAFPRLFNLTYTIVGRFAEGIYARDPYMYAPPPGSAYMMNSGRYGYGYPRYGYSRGYGYPYGGGWGAGTV